MTRHFFANTHSLTGRLAWFFALFSIVIGVLCYVLIAASLYYAEDRVSERRINIDRDDAIAYFNLFPKAKSVQLDSLTSAYSSIESVPAEFHQLLMGKDTFLDETGSDPESHMIYMDNFYTEGEQRKVIVISLVDRVEMTQKEFIFVVCIALALVSILLVVFGILLNRLSTRLIEPVSQLSNQLHRHEGDTSKQFRVSNNAASEFQLLSKQLNEYRTQVNTLLKREQAFARYASHELRTPLTVMKGSSSLLSRSEHSAFEQRQIDRIKEATENMSGMVDALLSLVRYERNQDDTPLRVIEKQEIEYILRQNQAQADQKQIEFKTLYEGSPETKASSAVINILLSNMIRNAIAASQEGEVVISIDSSKLEVIDQGRGLDGDSGSKEEATEGHGLGLLIIHDLCERYQWRFTLQNAQQQGCIATIYFQR
ncbi:sensor histidine kinase [Vibrio astriarenae]|uniref:sensor histidine kinase n=1 Tax=Vibrio astriarenae TaxID=1481923 RepID=UPI003734E635